MPIGNLSYVIIEDYRSASWRIHSQLSSLLHANSNLDSSWEFKMHQRVDRLVCGIHDVKKTFVNLKTKVLTCILVGERRLVDDIYLFSCRQRNRTNDRCSGFDSCIDKLLTGLINETMVIGLKSDSDSSFWHMCKSAIGNGETGFPVSPSKFKGYLVTLVTTPAPTVCPPSRMANFNPSSRAIGAISFAEILMLSPGMTISTPSGRNTSPVTSVVRM